MNKIAVLIPCYNEADTIARVVTDFKEQLPEAEVYVYDNNSSDDTVDEARRAGAIVRSESRQGKGNVVRSMFRQIDADCYLMVDGDDTYPASRARQMCQMVLDNGIDMVIGNRLGTNYLRVNKRPLHNTGNLFVCWLINRLFGSQVPDIMTGYRAMNRSFVKHMPILSKGFEIETEMTIHALDHNCLIQDVPVNYRNRPEGSHSKLSTFGDGLRVLKTIFLLFRDYRPFLFFSTIAYMLALLAVVLMIPVYREYMATGLVPRFPTLIGSGFILLFAIILWTDGLILEVIGKKHRQLYELLLNN